MAALKSSRTPPRLMTLLMVSHALLAALLAGALAIGLFSLGRIDTLLRELREQTLGEIDEEATLHRKMWSVETAMRHAIDACDRGTDTPTNPDPVQRALDALRDADAHIGVNVTPALRAMGDRYEALAEAALRGARCESLRSPASRHDRLALDEALTDLWIDRSFELHRALIAREETARVLGRRALGLGLALLAAAALTAALLARWIERSISGPLESIAAAAQRVGRGDFAPITPVRGPAEVVALGAEIDAMRAHLAELDSLKQGFLASVSHEMRTPLAKIREALALLGDGTAGPLTDRQTSVLRIARAACEQEIRLVTTLLDLSRLRGGSPVKLESKRSLDDAVREAVVQETPEAQRRRVEIDLDLSGPAPTRALDAVLVERAIANLLRNAVSVSPPGERVRIARLEVGLAPADVLAEAPNDPSSEGRAPLGWACVRVTDRGPGVAPEARATLFEPFATHAIDGLPARVGVGLGLALAHAVAQAHGGVLRLALAENARPAATDASVQPDSAPATRGATFELWLPIYDPPAERRASRRPTTAVSSVSAPAMGSPHSREGSNE